MPSSSPRRGARASSERVLFFFEALVLTDVCVGLGGDGRASRSTYAGLPCPRAAARFCCGVATICVPLAGASVPLAAAGLDATTSCPGGRGARQAPLLRLARVVSMMM